MKEKELLKKIFEFETYCTARFDSQERVAMAVYGFVQEKKREYNLILMAEDGEKDKVYDTLRCMETHRVLFESTYYKDPTVKRILESAEDHGLSEEVITTALTIMCESKGDSLDFKDAFTQSSNEWDL